MGDVCMSCLVMGGLTQHAFVRSEYLRSVDIPPAETRLILLLAVAAGRYLCFLEQLTRPLRLSLGGIIIWPY